MTRTNTQSKKPDRNKHPRHNHRNKTPKPQGEQSSSPTNPGSDAQTESARQERQPRTPSPLSDDELLYDLTPRKERLLEKFRKEQQEKDELRDRVAQLERAEANQNVNSPTTPCGNSSTPQSEDVELTDQQQDAVRRAAGAFVITCAFWVPKDIFRVELTDNFNHIDRYENSDSRAEGARRDMEEILKSRFTSELIAATELQDLFFTSITYHHSSCAQRVRKSAGDVIFDISSSDLLTPESRQQFATRIGFNKEESKYETWKVELLHRNYAQRLDIQTVFTGPAVLRTFAAIAYGKDAAGRLRLSNEKSIQPVKGTINAVLWRLTRTEPGIIAISAVLARWALSMDSELRQIGDKTGINWAEEYERYVIWLEKALRERRKSILALFRTWDSIFFPGVGGNAMQSEGQAKADEEAMRELEADELETSPESD